MARTKQVVLVTGCSSGIGRALAQELAARGNRVFATARRPETLEGLDGVERRAGAARANPIEKLALDVLDEASIAAAVGAIVDREGRLDVVVNNAGVNTFGPLPELPIAHVRRMFETNVLGLLAVTQAVFPHMAAQRSGRIVNVGSVVGLLPTPFAGAYCATKAAVHMMSDVLRMELEPFGIDVVIVQPGRVRSSIAENGSSELERFGREGSRFRPVHAQIEKRAQYSQQRPMPTEEFARIVADGVLADDPPRVVRAGGGSGMYAAASRLPRAVLDRVMRRTFDLGALANGDRTGGA